MISNKFGILYDIIDINRLYINGYNESIHSNSIILESFLLDVINN